jgi:hypothetical protein
MQLKTLINGLFASILVAQAVQLMDVQYLSCE